MKATPKPFEVCVLIPFYNNLAGLKKSLRSIVYSPGKLAILVVDDGSKVPLELSEIGEAVANGITLILHRESENQGITHALNTGLRWIRNNLQVNYIARLDCGDTCTSDRFTAQVQFLKANPAVFLVGSWCVFKDPNSSFSYTYTTPTSHPAIIAELHYRNVFIHPTVMFRREVLEPVGLYPEDYPHVEDYAFFMKIGKQFETAILPKCLVTCEINPNGISIANRKLQLKGRGQVIRAFGKNAISIKLGLVRLWLLQQIPYSWILTWKQWRSDGK